MYKRQQKVSDGDDLLDKLQYYKSGEKIEAVIARATNGEYEENTIEMCIRDRYRTDPDGCGNQSG